RRAARGLAQRLSLGPTPGGGGEKVRLQFLSASQDPLLSAIAGGAVSSTRVLLRVPLLAGMCTAGNAPYSAGRLGGVSSRTLLWAPHLAESLITGHLDPRLPRHADARTFRIDLPEEVERKINIDPLFRHMAIGKMGRDIFPPLCAFGNGFNFVVCFGLIGWFVHRLVVPGQSHAKP